jgi:hypothetical protein
MMHPNVAMPPTDNAATAGKLPTLYSKPATLHMTNEKTV